jgi:UDP-GlcNAc:undecaprenyl-phosphate GlcNAc-1-phosphate transferase
MPLALAAVFVVASALSAGLTAIARALARRVGFLDNPGGRKRHTAPTPLGGGVAVFGAVAVVVIAGLAAAAFADRLAAVGLVPGELLPYAAGALGKSRVALGVLGCALLLHLAGLYDDARGLSPLPKLLFQIAAATAVVVGFDVRATFFVSVYWATAAASILWIVAITNSFNFLDNMDGLCAGVAAVCTAVLASVALVNGEYFVAALLAALLGALLGFLYFNFPPATIFLGDAGSQVIGFLLGCTTLLATYYGRKTGVTEAAVDGPDFAARAAVLIPVLVLAVPLYDTLSVILIRLRAGDPIWKADNRHFSHRLRARGLSVRQTALVVYACTFAAGAPAAALGRVPLWAAGLVAAWAALVVLGLAIVEQTGWRAEETGTRNAER